ncbi:MAG: EamA family transporter [Acidimicrobiia bacterium]|nr:EamA family transporter [Acidimicrobiia bacterium]
MWGAAFLVIKIGTDFASPQAYVTLRVLASAATLVVVRLLRTRRTPILRDRQLQKYGLLLALFNVAVFLPLQTTGIAMSTVGVSALLLYTQPLFVALLGFFFLRERLSATQRSGLVLGWIGVSVLAVTSLGDGTVQPAAIVILIVGALSWAIGSIIYKSMPSTVNLWDVLLLQNLYALPVLIVLSVSTDSTITWNPSLLVSVIAVGAGAGVGGFAILFTLLRRGKAGVVSAWIYAVPIIGAFLGVVFRDEQLTVTLIVGAVMVGVALVMVAGSRREPPPVA